jgi:RimJ/RimL family protein N-acetyltransferase
MPDGPVEHAPGGPHARRATASPDTAHARQLHAAVAWPVRTARLTLRPPTHADLGPTWQFRRLPEVSRWLTQETGTLDEYRHKFLEPDSLKKSLVVERDGHVVGDLMLDVQDAWAQAEVADRARGTQGELGWVLHPSHTGHGYATEAVRALLDIAFDELGLRRVTAACFAANESSWRLMERVGMRRETYNVRDSLHRSGDWLDGMVYALLGDEHRTHTPSAAAAGHPSRNIPEG